VPPSAITPVPEVRRRPGLLRLQHFSPLRNFGAQGNSKENSQSAHNARPAYFRRQRTMTNNIAPGTGLNAAPIAAMAALEDLDLTPQGLSDAPANQLDPDTLVHPGAS
jgi:hypothetical protein